MRHVITGIVVGGIVALLVSLHAVGHSMPLASCHVPAKRWSALTLEQQERYVKCNLHHARTAVAWIQEHRELYNTRTLASVAVVALRDHRALLRKATRNLRAIQDRLYLTGDFATRYRIVTEIVCSFDWHGTPCSGSYSVMRVTLCETGGTLLAEPGDDPDSQYRGLFELGDAERRQYGVGRYHSGTYADVYAGAWDQVTAAHNLFVGEGRGWSPWACRPDGSVAY